MGNTSHSVLQSSTRILLPGIGMATANDNSGGRKFFDRCQRPFCFRRDCDALDYVAMFEQASNQFGRGLTDKFGILRASLIPRDKRPFNVCSRDLGNLFPKFSDLCEGKEDFREWGSCGG